MIEITDLLPNGIAQIRETREDGKIHRSIKRPGDDLSDLSKKLAKTIRAHWTPEVMAAWAEAVAEDAAPTPTVDDFSRAVSAHLDRTVAARGYDSVASAVSYAGDPNPVYAAEAAAARDWRSAVWTYATGELAKVAEGRRKVPTVAGFIAELPAIVWP